MILAVLRAAKVGDLLVRRSRYTDIPVVVKRIEGNILTVGLRPEQQLENIQHMTVGMMHLGAEGSPVQMIKDVGWHYDITTGDEIDPSVLGESILLKGGE
jgi:hypothetical protein